MLISFQRFPPALPTHVFNQRPQPSPQAVLGARTPGDQNAAVKVTFKSLGGSGAILERRQTESISTSPYAASTASHTCRIMALGQVISDVSNCPFLILFANSIPLNVNCAFPNVLNPSIG